MCVIFLFMNIVRDNLLMQFFYIQSHKKCSSKKILYQYFVDFFLPVWDNFSSKDILYVITYQ